MLFKHLTQIIVITSMKNAKFNANLLHVYSRERRWLAKGLPHYFDLYLSGQVEVCGVSDVTLYFEGVGTIHVLFHPLFLYCFTISSDLSNNLMY